MVLRVPIVQLNVQAKYGSRSGPWERPEKTYQPFSFKNGMQFYTHPIHLYRDIFYMLSPVLEVPPYGGGARLPRTAARTAFGLCVLTPVRDPQRRVFGLSRRLWSYVGST